MVAFANDMWGREQHRGKIRTNKRERERERERERDHLTDSSKRRDCEVSLSFQRRDVQPAVSDTFIPAWHVPRPARAAHNRA